MKRIFLIVTLALVSRDIFGQDLEISDVAESEAGKVTSHSDGYHGYAHEPMPADSEYRFGMGFYSSVWSLVDKPLANFQIGLPGAWILPDNSDNKDKLWHQWALWLGSGRSEGLLGTLFSRRSKADWVIGQDIISATVHPSSA